MESLLANSSLDLSYPFIDPVLLTIGAVELRWYGLACGLAAVVGCIVLYKELKRKGGPIPLESGPTLAVLMFASAMIGARLWFVFTDNPLYFLGYPQEIFATYKGGLSFHGALLGAAIVGWGYSRFKKVSFWELADIGALAVTPGIILVRLGNFVNGELFGRVTDLPWGIVFPGGGLQVRHPCQLYEAFLGGIVLFSALWLLRLRTKHPGELAALFLIGYGAFRFFLEFLREPAPHMGLLLRSFTFEQLICLPMIGVGVAVLFCIKRSRARESSSEKLTLSSNS